MTKKKKEILAKEVTRLEFIDLLKRQIELAKMAITQAEMAIAIYVDLFNKIELDKCRYNLKYYVIGDGLSYERTKRKKIGF